MASDLSSGCTDSIGGMYEKEEGEISLEDVSSSDEGNFNYVYGSRTAQCSTCFGSQHCASWCNASTKNYHHRSSGKRDVVQGKENRHYAKESGSIGLKHSISTLQEKNDDLMPISSDSDMEIVGLTDNSKQILLRNPSRTKLKKKKKKKKNNGGMLSIDDLVSSSTVDVPVPVCLLKQGPLAMKADRLLRSHHREATPVHRNTKPKMAIKSPLRRNRVQIHGRSPLRKSRSPISRVRSPQLKRSPRKVRSPRRSPHRSLGRAMSKKPSRCEHSSAPPSYSYNNTHANLDLELLRKVRQLDSVGMSGEETNVKNKEHASSLKEKLSNMMKGSPDSTDIANNYSKDKQTDSHGQKNDADDDEDLALLRQKALETKQKRPIKVEQIKPKSEEKRTTCYDEDHDEEDLELRMIALRSAVLKKHQDRVQRGVKSKKIKSPNDRTESPFTQSFLDSIPIPNEKSRDSVSPIHPLEDSIINTEDMDLDTDVEMEKEKLPYSPTDKITTDIPLDTEMLGIQPSDVSFINVNKTESSAHFDNDLKNNLDHTPEIIKNKSFLPKTEISYFDTNTDAPYSPSDSVETSKDYNTSGCQLSSIHCNVKKEDHNLDNMYNAMDVENNQERPYSPTDAPLYDPDLSQTLAHSLQTSFVSNASLMSIESSYAGNLCANSCMPSLFENSQLQHVQQQKIIETFATKSHHVSSITPSVSTTDAIISVDQLSTTSAIVPSCVETFSRNAESLSSDLAQEPLYMQGIPDVTKDVNKIPTLINRTLVPAPILKSNKQLQQPLPIKKQESHTEATFKNAEMQPVPIELNANMNMGSHFKPIRLAPIAKKVPTVLSAATVGFQNCLNDGATNAAPAYTEDFHSAAVLQPKVPVNTMNAMTHATEFVSKRKRNRRRSGRRRANNSTSSINGRTFNSNKNNNNNNINNNNNNNNNNDDDAAPPAAAAITNNNNIKELEKNAERDENVAFKQNDCQSNEITTTCKGNNDSSIGFQVSHAMATKSLQRSKSLSPSHGRALDDSTASSASAAEIQKTDGPSESKTSVARRPSLDEDEEALRAILLASLTKRTKPCDTNPVNTPPVTTLATGSSNDATIETTQAGKTSSALERAVEKTLEKHSTASTSQTNVNIGEQDQRKTVGASNNDAVKECQQNRDAEKLRSSLTTNVARKRSLSASKSPARKFTKKVSIPASTKVVNNAKKYQNTLVQKKLNLQKTTSLYKTKNVTEIKSTPVTLPNVKLSENKWTGNPATKTVITSDMQRIVISLESDTESDSEHERQKTNSIPLSNCNKVEKRQVLTIPTSDFEKSVDQFLKDVRKKQESAVASKQPVTALYNTIKKNTSLTVPADNKNTTSLHTPLAVRHLPVSQQEEYRRLKQQIIEYEKLKLKRSAENAASKQDKNKSVPGTTTHVSALDNATLSNKEDQIKLQNANTKLSPSKGNTLGSTNVKKKAHVPGSQVSVNKTHVSNVIGKHSNDISSKIPTVFTKVSSRVQNNLKNNTETTINEKTQTTNQSAAPSQEIEGSTSFVPYFKALTKEELNRKIVQIQVEQYESAQMATVNSETNSSEKQESLHSFKENANKIVDNATCEKNKVEEKRDAEKDSDKQQDSSSFREEEMAETTVGSAIDDTAELNALHTISSTVNQNLQYDTKNNEILESPDRVNVTPLRDTIENQESCNSFSVESHLSPDRPKTNMEEFWETIRRDAKTELDSLINLPRFEQERHLMDTEHKLVMQRYMVLDDLAKMSENLRQWDMERDLQTNLVEEVKRLREQLRIAEEKLQIHRNRINNMGPKVMVAHGKINEGRRECFKLTRICMVLGTKVIGQHYKLPEAGAHLLDNKVKEVANHTRQLSKKKVPSVNSCVSSVQSKKDTNSANASIELSQESAASIVIRDTSEHHSEEIAGVTINSKEDLPTVDVKEPPHQVEVKIEEPPDQIDVKVQEPPQQVEVKVEEETLSAKCDTHETVDSVAQDNQSCVGEKPSQENDSVTGDEETNGIPSTSTLPKNLLKEEKVEHHHNTKKIVEPYVSMLTHLKVPRNMNPNGVLCPYELMGTCNDGECQFVHQFAGHS